MQSRDISGVDRDLSSALISAPNSSLLSVTSAHSYFLVQNASFATMWPDFKSFLGAVTKHSLAKSLSSQVSCNELLFQCSEHPSHFPDPCNATHGLCNVGVLATVCDTMSRFVWKCSRSRISLHDLDGGLYEGSSGLTFIAAGGSLTFCWIWSFLLPSLRELLSFLLHPVRKR